MPIDHYDEVNPGSIFPPRKTITNFTVALVNDLIDRINLQLGGSVIYYVSTEGSDEGEGTYDDPFATLQHAHDVAIPGSTIQVRGGTYYPTRLIDWTKSGITCTAFRDEVPIFNAINYATPEVYNDRVMRVHDCSGVTFIGLHFTQGPDGGVQVNGMTDGVWFIRCEFYRNGRASVAEGQGIIFNNDINGGLDQVTNCKVIDCDSYFNFDVLGDGNNADGFQMSVGEGCEMINCRAWRNADDGFDCFNISFAENQTTSPVLIQGCWAWENGILEDGSDSNGDGNGFKLGGQRPGLNNQSGGNTMVDCMSWSNREIGVTDNECTIPNTIYNCTFFNNRRQNVESGTESGGVANVIRNCIAYFATEANVFIYDDSEVDHNSWDIAGLYVSQTDWVSIDPTRAQGPRNTDGTRPLSSFLVLCGNSPFASDMLAQGVDVGLPFEGSYPNLGQLAPPQFFTPPPPLAETLAVIAEYASPPDEYMTFTMDYFVRLLVAGGVWDKLDALWVFAAPSAADGLINWINPGTHDMVGTNSPTFVAWEGYNGNGTDSYLSTTTLLDAFTKFQQNEASLGVFCMANVDGQSYRDMGAFTSGNCQMRLQGDPATSASCYLNSSDFANGINVDRDSSYGLFVATRVNATTAHFYHSPGNEVNPNPAQTSTTVPSEELNLGRADSAYSPRQYGFALIGGTLTEEDVLSTLWTAMANYLVMAQGYNS